MYKLVCFTNKASKEQLDTANLWIEKMLEKKEAALNIPTYRVEDNITNNCIVISFGHFCKMTVEQYLEDKKLSNIKHIALPHPDKLIAHAKNKETRLEAFDKLKKVKELLEEDRFFPDEVVIKEEDLPELEEKQLLLLKKMTEEYGKDSCFQTSLNGKLVQIGSEPIEDSKADIFLTFEEIFTIRNIMSVLGVTEVSLVSNNKESNN